MLDPVPHDFFTEKLLASLRAIGNPQMAGTNLLVRRATGQQGPGSRRTTHTPPADFLWNCQAMAHATVVRTLPLVRSQLVAHGLDLNPTQWQAWEDALTHRSRLVWGPPGTGKSRTVRAIIVGAILEAHHMKRSLRILMTASTYTAIDNVLYTVAQGLHTLLGGLCSTYRVRSHYQPPPTNIAPAIDVALNRPNPSLTVRDIQRHLQQADNLIVVGAPPEQVHNLLICHNGSAQQEWFDLIVIDEASQMDVAHAMLPLCGIASTGSVVLAGDPLQLPPIHQAEAPIGPRTSWVQSMPSINKDTVCRKVHWTSTTDRITRLSSLPASPVITQPCPVTRRICASTSYSRSRHTNRLTGRHRYLGLQSGPTCLTRASLQLLRVRRRTQQPAQLL